MSKNGKALLIDNIARTYKNEAFPVLTAVEIKNYIESTVFFEDVLTFNKTGILIIEYRTWSYLYCSSNLKHITGYDASDALKYGPQFTLSHVHTDDLINQEKAHRLSVEIFNGLPSHEKGKYKFAFTFKHHNPDGKEVTILQTSVFLKWDEHGRPLVKLILVSDITAYNRDTGVLFFVSKLNEEGKNKLVLQKNFTTGKDPVLSSREIEIINLVATGQSENKRPGVWGSVLTRLKITEKTLCKSWVVKTLLRQSVLQDCTVLQQ